MISTCQPGPKTEKPLDDPSRQSTVVHEHFRDVSDEWARRYQQSPRRMSDLDMLLRRGNVQRLLQSAFARCEGTPRLLDLGCGSGHVLAGLPPRSANIVGMDLVPEMVASAARVHPQDHFLVGDAATLPLAEKTVDVTTCIGVLEYLPDPAGALRAIHRTLRPGGHLIISFPNRTSLFRKLSRWEGRAEKFMVALRDRLKGQAPAGPSAPKYHHTQWSVGQAWQLLHSAGFAVQGAAFNTYGLWGWCGRRKVSLRFSEWMSKTFQRRSSVSSLLACTMVVWAQKPR